MILVLLGPPGSGKGTQAKRLSAEKRWPQLSTGDMLRSAIEKKSALGLKAKEFMDKGSLVPDSVVIGLINERIKEPDCARGFILDGFPRTIPQAEALQSMLSGEGKSVQRAVLFSIPENELVDRLSGRRTCPQCGSMYHIQNMKPKREWFCDNDGAELVHRPDDYAEVIKKRMGVYHAQTEPLVDFYKSQGLLRTINALQTPQEVEEDLAQQLSGAAVVS
jgi:adenylate kinase